MTGRCARGERRSHRVGRHVAQVDQHSEAVHFVHHLDAERRETVMHRRVGRRVGPRRVAGVRQRHVARAGVIHLAQHRQGIIDLMAAFDADQRSDFVGFVNAANIRGGVGHRKVGRILRRHAFDQIDLFQGHLHRFEALRLDRYPHRPELRADMSGTQPRDVRHQRRPVPPPRAGAAVSAARFDRGHIALEALADFPRQIVVAVDERRLQQHLIDAMLIVLAAQVVSGRHSNRQRRRSMGMRFTL